MTLRFTDRTQLEHMPAWLRQQVEQKLAKAEADLAAFDAASSVREQVEAKLAAAEGFEAVDAEVSAEREKINKLGLAPLPRDRRYPEEAAGRRLVKWTDRTPLPARHVPPALLRERIDPIMIGELFVHTPNGGYRGPGKEAAILIGQGVRRGWPDYTLYVPVPPAPGLVLELKADDAPKPDDEQLKILRRLELFGWRARVCWGFDDAQRAIADYLGLEL